MPRKSLPQEEERALSNLIGPIPGLRSLPDPNSDDLARTVKHILTDLRDKAIAIRREPLGEVMARCLAEIDREGLPAMMDNIRYQIGVVVIGLSIKEDPAKTE